MHDGFFVVYYFNIYADKYSAKAENSKQIIQTNIYFKLVTLRQN